MRAPCKELSPFSARASLDTCGVGAVLGERVLSLALLGLYRNMAGGCARVGHVGWEAESAGSKGWCSDSGGRWL